ncbi:MAG: hypothetical protein IPP42_00995 [Saprospiraceae bacterium]|nr:hypothetical protein [Saprospiraceae bacterium]
MNNTDLYAQLEFLVPAGLLGSQEFFRREYANPIDKDGSQEKIQVLSKITAPFIMRRTKNKLQQTCRIKPSRSCGAKWKILNGLYMRK